MLVQTKYRSNQSEIMDDLAMEGDLLRKTLDQIATINRTLGGNSATINGLHTLCKELAPGAELHIIDLGCGSGDMLRAVAHYGRKKNLIFKLTGIDANEFTVNYARERSMGYPEISYVKMDVQEPEFLNLKFDIALATLFLHHFRDDEIEKLLTGMVKNSALGIIVNDLHRCRAAYYLFKLVSLFINNPMVKNDGAVSVLRGFKKQELINSSEQLKGTVSSIRWQWAFRYQWIIKKSWQ
ncbi:MAG: methyltransferase domain-containing protein [Ferruginibacter sp.]